MTTDTTTPFLEKHFSKIMWMIIVLWFASFLMSFSFKGNQGGELTGTRYDTISPTKQYEVKMLWNDWANKIQILNYISNTLKKTDLPARDVSFIADSLLAPLVKNISEQLLIQQAKDTLKHN